MKRAKITGLPAKHPVCRYCGAKLKAITHDTHGKDSEGNTEITKREFIRWDGYSYSDKEPPRWCRLKCARGFADMAFDAGLRRKGLEG